MEIYSAYSGARTFLSIFFKGLFQDKPTILLLFWSLGIGVALWLTLFILQGFGLYTMAKRQGLKKRWMAFIPFLNILFMGKIAGECRFFNRKMKNAGTYAMIAQILATVTNFLMLAALFYLHIQHGDPAYTEQEIEGYYGYVFGYYYWPTATTGLGKVASWYYDYGEYFTYIIGLIYEILMLVLVIAVLKKYNPKYYFWLSILALFVPMSRYIILFVLRNREPVDFEAMMRARHEAYMRRQQQYYGQYGNPYNRPYGTPYNGPYGAPQQTPPQEQPSQEETFEEPFEEFASESPTPEKGGSGGKDAEDFFD